ncbi:MAG: hypothetical protein ABSB22_20995 [Thermodesulfobacteriota bacterium]|jgi:hypothetical protein
MNAVIRRIVSFAGSSVSVEYSGERAAGIVDFLYGSLPITADTEDPLRVKYQILPFHESNQLHLHREGILIYEGNSDAELADVLLGSTGHDLADRSRSGLLFHSGALFRGEKGLLLPGGIAAGKTTLTFWLARRGFNYLTDEMAFLRDGADTFQAFTRPLNLKAPSRAVLKNDFDFEGNASKILSTIVNDLISPVLLNCNPPDKEAPLDLLFFPQYRPNSDFILQPLSRAQAGLELMKCLVNARNLPDHGFPEITRLARKVPAYRMLYSHFDQIGHRIETIVESSER